MEDDASWVTLLDDCEPPEELLDALLKCERAPVSRPASEQIAATRPRQRKRTKYARPLHEIRRLRSSIGDVESLVALLKQRRASGLAVAATGTESGPAIWQQVATREYQRLREAQTLHQTLREQLVQQRGIVQGLLRLVQRASAGLPSVPVPRAIAEANAAAITNHRRRLEAAIAAMYSAERDVISWRRDGCEGESHNQEVTDLRGGQISPGDTLATTTVARVLPATTADIGDCLWRNANTARAGSPKIEHTESTAHSQVHIYSVDVDTPYGHVHFHGVGLRARFIQVHGHLVLTASCMYPSEPPIYPLNAIAFDTSERILVQTHSTDSELSEVLTRLTSCRLEPPHASPQLSFEQTAVLRGISWGWPRAT